MAAAPPNLPVTWARAALNFPSAGSRARGGAHTIKSTGILDDGEGSRTSPPPVAGAVPRLVTRDFALACVATLLFFTSFYFLMPLMPLYAVDVGASPGMVGIVVGAFTLSSLALRPLVGRGIDRRGRRPFMAAGAIVFTVVGFMYGAAHSVAALIAVRVLHGTGIACYTTSSNTYIADIAPAARRGEAISYYGMFINLAMAYAPALGALMHGRTGFQGAFWASSCAGAVALAVIAALREPPRVAAGAAAPSPRSREALISRSALFPALVCASCTITYGAVMAFLPLLAAERGASGAALFFAIYAVCIILSRLIGGFISDRRGRAAVIVPGLACAVLAMACLAFVGGLHGIVVAAALYGLGFGLALPGLNTLVVDRAAPAERGTALATYSAMFDLGIATGAIVLGSLAGIGGLSLVFGVATLVITGGLFGFILGLRARL